MVKALAQLFSYRFSSTIWQIRGDLQGLFLAIQLRNSEDFTSEIYLFNIEKKTLSKPIVPEEPWWYNLEHLVGEYLVIHEFPDEDDPGKTNLKIISVSTGKTLYHKSGARFLRELNQQAILIEDRENDKLIKLNESLDESTTSFEKEHHHLENNRIEFPFQYLEDDPDFETINALIKQKIQVTPLLGAEYLEYDSNILLSYLIQENREHLSNYLVAFNQIGETILFKKINDKMAGLGRDTFFIFAGKLICVENKQELHIYGL